MTTPNRYGRLAQQHMAEYLPGRYAQIGDPDSYFSALGEEILAQIEEIEPALAGPAPIGESWLDRLGRVNMARTMAEERVLAEMVFLPPEGGPDTEATPVPAGLGLGFPFYLDHEPEDQIS